MRLIDFLVLLLEAHADTLKRLAAFFGEEELLEMLESSESPESGDEPGPELDLGQIPFETTGSRLPTGARSPYAELGGAVRELGLPATLEFHLWAYPYYRAFIESDLDLGSTCEGSEALAGLIEQSITEAQKWVRKLPIPPSVAIAAETAAQLPWIRFRTSALKKLGLRPMESIRSRG